MPPGRLEVNVLDAIRLKDTQTFGKQDPYVKIFCGAHRERTKTHTDGGTKPRWNERFLLALRGDETELEAEVWNENQMVSDNLISRCTIPLSEVFEKGVQDVQARVMDKKGNATAGELVMVLRFAAAAAAPPMMQPQAMAAGGTYQQPQMVMGGTQQQPQMVMVGTQQPQMVMAQPAVMPQPRMPPPPPPPQYAGAPPPPPYGWSAPPPPANDDGWFPDAPPAPARPPNDDDGFW
jgi:hypothetical protein